MEGGPAGPEVIEPLALLVCDNSADTAGQHSVTHNTVVEGGPAGPEVTEPLELLVLDHAVPAGQHAVIRDTTRWLEHPLAWPESSLRDGLVEKISDRSQRHVFVWVAFQACAPNDVSQEWHACSEEVTFR